MDKVFDFHFHMLFKHFISKSSNNQDYKLDENIKTTGLAGVFNDLFGGPFNSQSSPSQIIESQLFLGVTSILSVEHGFAAQILKIAGVDISAILPLDWNLINDTKDSNRKYWDEFNRQLDFHINSAQLLKTPPFNIQFLKRTDFKSKTIQEIKTFLMDDNMRNLVFSIEGGHNLSNVFIHNSNNQISLDPEKRLKELQDRNDIDFISINLSHLSDIPEQRLGGFAQGQNKLSQIAFHSNDFLPKFGLGLTESGKRVIRQALFHPNKPILIDIKHMSLYTRLEFYKYREKLIQENPEIANLPIVSTHSGLTFDSVDNYIQHKPFRSTLSSEGGLVAQASLETENRKIGHTNDLQNKGLFCNPWTINFFDDEIIEIMNSKGMLGISIDQRILGAAQVVEDSLRPRFFEPEFVSGPEWVKLFQKGEKPELEGLEVPEEFSSGRPERHIMLLCCHIIHAVKVGYSGLNWLEGTSPWHHICLGTDFDGLINPINGYDNVKDLQRLRGDLIKYLPLADKFNSFYSEIKALKYNADGTVNMAELDKSIDNFLFLNGVNFISRFLFNWQ